MWDGVGGSEGGKIITFVALSRGWFFLYPQSVNGGVFGNRSEGSVSSSQPQTTLSAFGKGGGRNGIEDTTIYTGFII